MRIPLLAMAVALLLAGCAGSGTKDGTAPDATSSGTGAPTTTAPSHMAAKTVDVKMQGNRFVNETVTIYVGDSIRWTNLDSVGHSVKTDSGPASIDNKPNCVSGILPAPVCMGSGETLVWKSASAGTIAYHCPAHAQGMKGTLVVLEHPA
ncbi:MAG TPA: plastocyanin/azurin family copper-binding protein [Candidatus Thermoplasmatota archaeon]|nr:plastocyanin/azurin family copper-binding protein [Candidatus Thermoplasmatota archaeon]